YKQRPRTLKKLATNTRWTLHRLASDRSEHLSQAMPTRQSYLMAVVSPAERSAAAGITGVARTAGTAVSSVFVGLMFARPALINLPFFIAGTLKIAYDLLLYREFVGVRPLEEICG